MASSVVWLVIAMSLFATDSIPVAWRRLHPSSDRPEPDDSAFTKARQRLGVAPLRELFREVARPIAATGIPGAFYRTWRLVGIDGTTFDMPDTPANERVFGRGGNQRSPNAFPQIRVLALCELGTHAVCDIALRPIRSSEQEMVPHLLNSLQPDMLLLWDRGFFGFSLIESVLGRGCHLLVRGQDQPGHLPTPGEPARRLVPLENLPVPSRPPKRSQRPLCPRDRVHPQCPEPSGLRGQESVAHRRVGPGGSTGV